MASQSPEQPRSSVTIETELRAILAALSDAVIAADAGGRVTFMNPRAEGLTGWPEEEAKGRALAEIFRSPAPGVLLSRSDAVVLVEQRTATLGSGSAGGVVLTFCEAVDRARAEEIPVSAVVSTMFARAAERAARLQEVTAACSEARIPADVAALVVNQGCAMLGAPRGLLFVLSDDGAAIELVQATPYPPDVVITLQRFSLEMDAPLTEVVRTGQALFFATADALLTRYPHLVGARQPGDNALAAAPLVVEGRTLGVLGFIFDEDHHFDAEERAFILALARQCAQALDRARLYEVAAHARAAAEASNRAKDDFLATLSHELRTPLTAIVGWASILRTHPLEPGAHGRALQTIERNAHVLVHLIEDILDVSRIVAGKLRLNLERVDPAAVIRGAIDIVRPSADARQIAIDTAIDDGIGVVTADRARLQQIAWNLLSNAIKFTGDGGRVEVRLERVDAGVRLRVIDTGEGIDAAFLPRVFERFRQADSSNTRAHGGLGLGLAIVKHLVEQHGGTILAESGGLGLGATFTVMLPSVAPVDDDHGGPRFTEAPLRERPRLEGVRVVVVDDEPDAREVIAAILEEEGAIVDVAASAPEAIRTIDRMWPDVLVCDIGMPHEDGYALLKKVRRLGAELGKHVPSVALTAYAGAHDARMAKLAGFQEHLAKPVMSSDLIDVVAALARRDESRGPASPDAPA